MPILHCCSIFVLSTVLYIFLGILTKKIKVNTAKINVIRSIKIINFNPAKAYIVVAKIG